MSLVENSAGAVGAAATGASSSPAFSGSAAFSSSSAAFSGDFGSSTLAGLSSLCSS